MTKETRSQIKRNSKDIDERQEKDRKGQGEDEMERAEKKRKLPWIMQRDIVRGREEK